MDPTIYYCQVGKIDDKFALVPKLLDDTTSFTLARTFQPKIRDYSEYIRSNYLELEEAFLFANIDAIHNFSQRAGGFIAMQEPRQKLFYTKGIFSDGLVEYLRFRFAGADGFVVSEKLHDLKFSPHLLEAPTLNYYEMDAQLSQSFGEGIDVYVAPAETDEIYLSSRHLKPDGYALFYFEDTAKLTGVEFRLMLSFFGKVSVMKPLILTGTKYFFAVCSGYTNQRRGIVKNLTELPTSTAELENFEQSVQETFDAQNRINLYDPKQFMLSKSSVVWNIQ